MTADLPGREPAGLRELFEQAPAAMAVLRGPDHVFEMANTAYLALVGHRDVLGKPVAVALPEVVEQGFVGLLHQVYRTGIAHVGKSTPVVLRQSPDSAPEHRVLDFVYQPLRQSTGEITGIFVQATDVTDRVLAEQALHRQRRLYEAILTNTPDLAYIFDLSHRFIYANEGLLKMWGRTAAEALGKTCLELGYEPWHAAMHDREIEQVIATKRPIRGEVPFTGTFGRRIYDYLFVPVFNSKGEVEAVAGTTRDVTERKQIEAELVSRRDALMQSESRFRRLFDTNLLGVLYFHIDGGVQDANDQFLNIIGYTRDDLTHGRVDWVQMTPPEFKEQDARAVADLRQRGAHAAIEKQYFRKDGSRVWVLVGSALTDGLNGLGFVIDLSGLKSAEQALRNANRRKDEFLATLAHELRNPLAPIRNAVHLMKRVQPLDPQLKSVRDIIDRQVRHMVRLVDDLLDVSRITLGQVSLRSESVSLGGVLTEAIEAARPLIEASEHSLTVQLPSENMQIEGDGTRLSQVFQNLLNNAAKYTPKGGRIALQVDREGDVAVIRVRDNGIGIPQDLHERVFELFTRAHPSEEIKTSGLGIGLALAKQLVELHRGEIILQSAGTGMGSEFTVRLPLLPSAPTSHAIASNLSEDVRMDERRVLVVDDNQDAAESLAMLLQMAGCVVEVALDGASALTALSRFRPDVVLLDIGMPGMDGYTTARHMRAAPEGKAVFLVALTGWGQEEDKQRAREAGFDEHLTKPVDPSVLNTVLTLERTSAI